MDEHFSLTPKALGFNLHDPFILSANIHHPHPHSKALDWSNLKYKSSLPNHQSITVFDPFNFFFFFFPSLLVGNKHGMGWYGWQWVEKGCRKQMRRDESPKPLHIWCCIKGTWAAPIRPDGGDVMALATTSGFPALRHDRQASKLSKVWSRARDVDGTLWKYEVRLCEWQNVCAHSELLQACHKNITLFYVLHM